MVDVTFSQALNAYHNAQRIASSAAASPDADLGATGADQAGTGFWQMVEKNINDAVTAQYKGEAAGVGSLSHKVSPTDLAVAINNAELTLRTITSIRDRVISAYQDIIKMPV